ncbi:MAG: hypothetical protein ABJP44_06425 [Sulfitobacter sp.]|uniref:hypothetical protein n=2 Tax=Alphaproteobacteria TaxID=28211 RepID=UPI0032976632
MMSNNKILTVSYGTFSCTLEGFDDSFGTMKAIAEYFRDLASDDRYFGAEPPIPDAEMLARIAEKEISRRVEAREDKGKIVLSATDPVAIADSDTPHDDTADADAVQAAQMQAQELRADEMRAQEMRAQADAVQAQIEAKRLADESAAAEVQRAADAQAEADAETARVEAEAAARQAEQDQIDEAARTAHDAEILAATQIDVSADEAEDETTPPARDLAAELPEADAFFAQSSVEDADEANFENLGDAGIDKAAVVAGIVPHADSIAAKLERIRAVVSSAETSSDDDDDYSEDEHAEAGVVSDTPDAADVDGGLEYDGQYDRADDDDIQVDATASEDDDIVGDALADIEAALAADEMAAVSAPGAQMPETQTEDASDQVAETKTEATQTDSDDLDGDDDISAILAGLESSFDANEVAETDADDDDDLDAMLNDTMGAVTDASDNIFDAAPEDGAQAQDEIVQAPNKAAPPRRVARVIKVKRADLEKAIAEGDLEEVEEDLGPSSLSPEDEDDLMRELAQVEAETAPSEDAVSDLDIALDATLETQADIAAESNPDEDVSRLMAQTDAEMDDAEGAQNREAFAHLRAAVAAQKADGGLVAEDSEKQEVAYRTDLAKAVKPRRPSANGGSRSERPDTTPRPAPLKLVAEQRVDTPQTDLRGPVQPRRVASTPEIASGDADSFADYASELGAVKLPDLLEAAASYMSFIEGRDQFSRPQLMNKVRQVEKEEFSREDGLRSFGQLLRAGKIEKIKGGRFAVTGDIGYRPDARAAG